MQRCDIPRKRGDEFAQRGHARRIREMQLGLKPEVAVAKPEHAQILCQAAGRPSLQLIRIRVGQIRADSGFARPDHLCDQPIGADLDQKRRARWRSICVTKRQAGDAVRYRQPDVAHGVTRLRGHVVQPAPVNTRPRVDGGELSAEQLKHRCAGIGHGFARSSVWIQHADAVSDDRAPEGQPNRESGAWVRCAGPELTGKLNRSRRLRCHSR